MNAEGSLKVYDLAHCRAGDKGNTSNISVIAYNDQHYPLLRKHKLPFAIFIATSFPDRLGELWWIALEAVIARNNRIGMVINGADQYFECATARQKRELYAAIYGYLRSMRTEEEMRRAVRDLCACYNVDVVSFCRDLCMSWQDIA